MNIKTLVSSGYNLWASDTYTVVPVCEPEVNSYEFGAINVQAIDVVPNMRTFPEPTDT